MGTTSREVTRPDTHFTENARALLSSSFASPYLPQIYQLKMGILEEVLPDKAGCSVVSHPLTTSYQLPAIIRGCPPYCFPAIKGRAMGFIGVEFQSLHSHLPGTDNSIKQQQPEVQALSSQCFVYFLSPFHIYAGPTTAVVSSSSYYNELTNFKQPTYFYNKSLHKSNSKGLKGTVSLRLWIQGKIATNYQGH